MCSGRSGVTRSVRSIFVPSIRLRWNKFAHQVTALCQATGQILALEHLDRHEQLMQAEDDLEEWQAAEQFLNCKTHTVKR